MRFSACAIFLTLALVCASAALGANAAPVARPAHAAVEAPLSGDAWRWADAAFAAYKRRDYPHANALAAKALALRPDVARLWLLRVYALQSMGRPKDALQMVRDALAKGCRDPVLNSVRDKLLDGLESDPGSARPITQTPAWKLADAAYRDYAAGHYADAEREARESLSLQPNNPTLRSLLVYTLEREDKRADATREADTALAASPKDEAMLALRDRMHNLLPPVVASAASHADPGSEAAAAYAALAKGDYDSATQHAGAAVDAAPDNLYYHVLQVDALTLDGKRKEARQQFDFVLSQPSLPQNDLLAAAYAAQHLDYNGRARSWFSQSLDAGQLELGPQQRQNIRQAISDLDRNWGVNGALGYGSVGVLDPAFAPSLNQRHMLQSSEEFYWRPPVVGLRDGSTVEIYSRIDQTLYDGTGGPTGMSTAQGIFGARWKPFGRQNIVFAVERFVPIGANSRSDWLLRGAWSDGVGGGLSVDRSNWTYWQAYVEGDYFVQHPQTLGSVDVRYGRAFRIDAISSKFVATPYLGINAGYDSLLSAHTTLGIGPGIALRLWFREDTYHAPQSFVDLNLQYRLRIAGDDRSNGVFGTLSFCY